MTINYYFKNEFQAGVHCVGLPMVTQLAEMAQLPEEQKAAFVVGQQVNSFIFYIIFFIFLLFRSFTLILFMQDSVVEHLVCTQLSPSSPPAPVLGTAVHYPPNQVKFSYFPFKKKNKNNIFPPAHLPTERLPPPVPGALPAPVLLPAAPAAGIGRRCQPAEEEVLFIDNNLFFFRFHFLLLLQGILRAQDRRHAQEGRHPAEVICNLQTNIGLGFITGS